MRKINLNEIKKKSNSPEVVAKDIRISTFVRSQPNYSSGRKRPRDPGETKILAGFKRK